MFLEFREKFYLNLKYEIRQTNYVIRIKGEI